MDEHTVWMLFASESEVEELLQCASSDMSLSPFYPVEKWVEVLDHSPRIKGVPLHVWREAMFRRPGAYLGCTLEVDQNAFSREFVLRQSSSAARQIKDLSIQTHSGTEICIIL